MVGNSQNYRGNKFKMKDNENKKEKLLPEAQAQWASVRGKIRRKVGEALFKSWFKPLKLVSYSSGAITLSVPNNFVRTRLLEEYHELIKIKWKEQNNKINLVEIILLKDPNEPDHKDFETIKQDKKESIKKTPLSAKISADLDQRFTFTNFIVGKPNELAFAAARRVAESQDVPFNPLFLYGGVGLGKTHLMHAIAHEIKRRNPERRVIYLSAEKFMYHFIKALRFKDTVAFKEQFRTVDVLMIDDVQFISGKDSTQEEFFHTFNALVDQNKQLIISADKSPQDLEGIEERMRSRLGWGLVADIHPLNYELRLSILQAKEEKLQINVPLNVLEFLAHKITSNVRELEGALNRISAFSSNFTPY